MTQDGTWTRGGRALRRSVVGPLSHETWRRVIRETYPAQLPPVGCGWWQRYGHEVERRDQQDALRRDES